MNVDPSSKGLPAELVPLFDHLDRSFIRLDEFGCFVALSEDRKTIFWCPMDTDRTPMLDDRTDRIDWGEVTAPEPEFVDKVNELYCTDFQYEKFAGR